MELKFHYSHYEFHYSHYEFHYSHYELTGAGIFTRNF